MTLTQITKTPLRSIGYRQLRQAYFGKRYILVFDASIMALIFNRGKTYCTPAPPLNNDVPFAVLRQIFPMSMGFSWMQNALRSSKVPLGYLIRFCCIHLRGGRWNQVARRIIPVCLPFAQNGTDFKSTRIRVQGNMCTHITYGKERIHAPVPMITCLGNNHIFTACCHLIQGIRNYLTCCLLVNLYL